MRRKQTGILTGITAVMIDAVPMAIQKLTWDANISACSI